MLDQWKVETAMRPKTYSYLTHDNGEKKKVIGKKNCVINGKLKLEDYKTCLEVTNLKKQ